MTAYTAALALWRGPALADLGEVPFAVARALALEAARLGRLEAVVDLELAAGQASTWVVRLEELVAQHPTREPFWAQLMTALYRSGQQAAALEAYARARGHRCPTATGCGSVPPRSSTSCRPRGPVRGCRPARPSSQ